MDGSVPITAACGAGPVPTAGLRLDADGRMWFSVPRVSKRACASDVPDERRPETREPGSTRAPHARVDDAERARLQQALGERLRFHVASRVEAGGETACATQIVEARAEVGEVVVVRHALVEPVDFRELDGLV